MSGSGARDGFGSPPWDPADPVPHPDLDDTQALPGLGSIPGRSGPVPAPGGGGPAADPGDFRAARRRALRRRPAAVRPRR